ncbi:MAG: hypothetical protein DRO11_05515 [Methanobacteriota archaeon]|nr:MAG: hypothetical protein DRO11_05515 [Euryarchaeota archaeon]
MLEGRKLCGETLPRGRLPKKLRLATLEMTEFKPELAPYLQYNLLLEENIIRASVSRTGKIRLLYNPEKTTLDQIIKIFRDKTGLDEVTTKILSEKDVETRELLEKTYNI